MVHRHGYARTSILRPDSLTPISSKYQSLRDFSQAMNSCPGSGRRPRPPAQWPHTSTSDDDFQFHGPNVTSSRPDRMASPQSIPKLFKYEQIQSPCTGRMAQFWGFRLGMVCDSLSSRVLAIHRGGLTSARCQMQNQRHVERGDRNSPSCKGVKLYDVPGLF